MILILVILGGVLGLIKYGSISNEYRNKPWQLKFAEVWNCSWNFILAGLVGYYFILIRWPQIKTGENLSLADFAVFTIFAMGLFGHINVLSKNITEGIQSILRRVLEK